MHGGVEGLEFISHQIALIWFIFMRILLFLHFVCLLIWGTFLRRKKTAANRFERSLTSYLSINQ